MANIRPRINKEGKITSYQITVSLGRDSEGKKIFKQTKYIPKAKTQRAIEKEVRQYADEWEDLVKRNRLYADKITFREFSQIWIDSGLKRGNQTQRVKEEYVRQLNRRIYKFLGDMPITEIKSIHVDKLIDSMISEDLKPSTIKQTYIVVNLIFQYAYKKEYIKENPCWRTDPLPSIVKDDKLHYFDVEQAERFLNDVLNMTFTYNYKGHTRTLKQTGEEYKVPDYTESFTVPTQYKAYFNLAIYGGFRNGETMALQWSDIDFDNNTVCISKAISRVSSGEIVKEPKTKSGKRTIKMPESCMRVLKEWKAEQRRYALKLGSYWTGTRGKSFDDNWLFIQDNGQRMNSHTPAHKFKKIIKDYNERCADEDLKLPEIRLHDLRHTSATLLLAHGTDIETVSKRLGHAKPSITLDVYGHALESMDEQAANTLETLFKKASSN